MAWHLYQLGVSRGSSPRVLVTTRRPKRERKDGENENEEGQCHAVIVPYPKIEWQLTPPTTKRWRHEFPGLIFIYSCCKSIILVENDEKFLAVSDDVLIWLTERRSSRELMHARSPFYRVITQDGSSSPLAFIDGIIQWITCGTFTLYCRLLEWFVNLVFFLDLPSLECIPFTFKNNKWFLLTCFIITYLNAVWAAWIWEKKGFLFCFYFVGCVYTKIAISVSWLFTQAVRLTM